MGNDHNAAQRYPLVICLERAARHSFRSVSCFLQYLSRSVLDSTVNMMRLLDPSVRSDPRSQLGDVEACIACDPVCFRALLIAP